MEPHQHAHGSVLAIPIPAAGGTAPIYNGQCLLLGWSIGDTSALANTVLFREGQDTSSQVVGVAALAASGSSTVNLGSHGVRCLGGISVTQTGAAVGSVFVLPIH